MILPIRITEGVRAQVTVDTLTIVYKGKEYSLVDAQDARILAYDLAKEKFDAAEKGG